MAALKTDVVVERPVGREKKKLLQLARTGARTVRIVRDFRGKFWVGIQRNPGKDVMKMVLFYGGFGSRKFAEGVAKLKTGQLTPVRTVTIDNCPTCGDSVRMMYPGNEPENGPAASRCVNRKCENHV